MREARVRPVRPVREEDDGPEAREQMPNGTPWWVLWVVRACTWVHERIVAFWRMSMWERTAAMFKLCVIVLSVLALMLFFRAIWSGQSVVTHWIATVYTEAETQGLGLFTKWFQLEAKKLENGTSLEETETWWVHGKRWWEKTWGHGFSFVQTLVTNFMSLTWVCMTAVAQFHQLRARGGQ